MILTNAQIYDYSRMLIDAFSDREQKLPIKINFSLSKNKSTLIALAQEIEKARLEIAQNYGTLNEEEQRYVVDSENVEQVNKEMKDLFDIEQDVDIIKINIDNINDDYALTTAQMEALMFMID